MDPSGYIEIVAHGSTCGNCGHKITGRGRAWYTDINAADPPLGIYHFVCP